MQNAQMVLPNSITAGDETHSLANLVDSLEQIVRDSEDDFLALGMNLQKVRMMSSTQRQKIAATMSLFKNDEDEGILQQVTAYVRGSQQDTESAQQTATNLCSDLAEMIKLMDSIAQKTHALERAGLFLHVIGINTGIECARHDRMEAMFKVVSQDTILLAEQIRSTTDTLLDQTAQARTEEEKTLSGARKSIESLQGLVQESHQATEIALGKVAELIDYSISMVNDVEQMSQNITSEINRVVMGIQFHDNLRQRIEHVNEVLLEAEDLREDCSEEEACNAYLSLTLQKAQLDNLVSELDTLYTTQAQAVANILDSISHLETRLESVSSERSDESSRENPVAVLLAGINSLEQLNNESLVLGREILASSERAEQIARNMHAAIESTFTIANSVKINALNAIIKAAKFGRIGESLQVLAQGMVSVAKDTRQLVSVFNDLIERLGELNGNGKSAAVENEVGSSAVDFDSARVEQLFRNFREELLASKQDCHGLAQSLEREQQHLIFIAGLKDALVRHAELLGAYAEAVRPENEELLARTRGSFGKQLEDRYTMNEEREIHNRAHQERHLEIDEQQAQADTAAILLFDDAVSATAAAEPELWGDEQPEVEFGAEESIEPPPSQQSPPEPAQDVSSGTSGWAELAARQPAEIDPVTVELWDDPAPDNGIEVTAQSEQNVIEERDPRPAQTNGSGETNEEEEDFGENVELF